MFLNLRRMPGANVSRTLQHRLLFSTQIGQKPEVDLYIEGSTDKVREFLISRLDMGADRADYVASSLAGYGVAAAEVDVSADELRTLVKALKSEARAAEAKVKAPSATVVEPTPSSITV